MPESIAVCESLLFGEERTAVRTATTKYVRWRNGREELYDLTTDPTEQHDRAACSDLAAARATYAAVAAGTPARALHAPAPESAVRTGLRALGYVR